MIDTTTRMRLATIERELAKAAAYLRDARQADRNVMPDPFVAAAAVSVTWALEEAQRALDDSAREAA